MAEVQGDEGPALMTTLKDIDDLIQAKLTDIRSKEDRIGLKVSQTSNVTL